MGIKKKVFFVSQFLHFFEILFNSFFFKLRSQLFLGVMKRAVKWPLTASTSYDRQPGRDKQDGGGRPVEKGRGRRQPGRKEQDGRCTIGHEKCIPSVEKNSGQH